jgi:hypothetical protein
VGGVFSTYGEKRVVYRGLTWKPEEKRPLGRPRRRWEDDIKMDIEEVGWEHGLDSFGSVYGELMGCNENSGSIKSRELLE